MPSPAPISFRLGQSDLAIIDRAARIRGHSRTEFVRDVAVREAERVVLDETVIRLSPADFAAVEAHLADPGEPSAALKDLLAGR